MESNVVHIVAYNDLIYVIPNYTFGLWEIQFDLYVPEGGDAYFNTLQEFYATPSWGMQVYFGYTNYGEGNIDAGGALTQIFTFDYDTWMTVKVTVDIENDWGEFYLDDVLIHDWIWSTGTFGTGTLNQLGGSNFYAWDGGVHANPNFYMDNYSVDFEGSLLDPPQNVTSVLEPNEIDVFIDWDPPAGGGTGELIELVQHDGNPENGYYQEFGKGYGVVYDISSFPDCTIEYLDFRHSSWGVFGTWDYILHIVDWDNYTEIAVIGPLQTTGDDAWELGISLGSIEGQSGLVGIFLEPLSNDPTNAYPCLDSDNVGPDGMSYQGLLNNYNGMTLSTIGDFLMDLWILTAETDQTLKAPKKSMTKKTEAELLGYNIYEDDTYIDHVPIPTTEYIMHDLDPGTYEFCVSAVYDEGESPQACGDPVVVPSGPGPGAYNLTGPDHIILGDTICLTWEIPWLQQWIRWDAGINTGNGIGYLSGGTFRCASHWYPEQLTSYAGLQIFEIEFYNNGDPDATYTIKIWTGPDANYEVLSQEVPLFNVDDWNTIVLNTPHTISPVEDLWIGYEITHSPSTFPAGCDDGPAIPYNGDMLYWVDEWISMSETLGFNYNWNLAAFVGLADGKDLILMTKTDQESHSITSHNSNYSKNMKIIFPPDGVKDFSHFNLYVKTPGASFFTVAGISAEPEICYFPTDIGSYAFYVTAVWDPEGESGPSNIHWVDVTYTGTDDLSSSGIMLYPNPASDIITIESDFEIASLKIYNPTGQTIVEKEVNNKNYNFDVSPLNPGIYFLKIEFEDEQVLKKIVVE